MPPAPDRRRAASRLALLAAAATLAGCHKPAPPVGPETVERIVRLSPHKVYRAFSTAVSESGTQLVHDLRLPNGETTTLTAAIVKTADQSIEISAETPTSRLFHLRLQFFPLDDSRATRLRAVVEVDPTMVADSAGMSPREATDMLKLALNRAIDQVAAGHPLKPLPGQQMVEGSTPDMQPSVHYDYGDPQPAEPTVARQSNPDDAETMPMRGGRVIPMQSARPMLDPDVVARQHSFSGNN